LLPPLAGITAIRRFLLISECIKKSLIIISLI